MSQLFAPHVWVGFLTYLQRDVVLLSYCRRFLTDSELRRFVELLRKDQLSENHGIPTEPIGSVARTAELLAGNDSAR